MLGRKRAIPLKKNVTFLPKTFLDYIPNFFTPAPAPKKKNKTVIFWGRGMFFPLFFDDFLRYNPQTRHEHFKDPHKLSKIFLASNFAFSATNRFLNKQKSEISMIFAIFGDFIYQKFKKFQNFYKNVIFHTYFYSVDP